MELGFQKKYRVSYHLLTWAVCIIVFAVEDFAYYPNWIRNIRTNAIDTILFSPVIYLNWYICIPKFLLNKFYLKFSLVSILSTGSVVILCCFIHFYFFGITYYKTLQGFIAVLSDMIFLFAATSVFKLLYLHYSNQKQIVELRNKTLEIELEQLKNQINPHFLFNNLNNLYFLIRKNAKLAQTMVLKLSELLNYQLYDNAKGKTDLKKEIANITNYLELEKIRHSDSIELKFLDSSKTNVKIAPMLLLPLLENAFKHGRKENGKLSIEFSIEECNRVYQFKCRNTYDARKATESEYESGIGMTNIKRRLELIYPNKHSFTWKKDENLFSVYLSLNLESET